MSYAVTYTYDPARSDIGEIRPRHREYLSGLYEAGELFASGPTGEHGALLLFAGDDEGRVTELLDGDPFHIEGIVAARTVTPWTPVIGPWA